jgi:uncharacterized LabA/DUF88 family protein
LRIAAFIDGFNLYHAVDDLAQHHLKWVNLRKVAAIFSPADMHDLTHVLYFSAYAKWRPSAMRRHTENVSALETVGVRPVMGRFMDKERKCRKCGDTFTVPEEKRTDVNIALQVVMHAIVDNYDRALLFTGDSDQVPTVELVRQLFPSKEVVVVAPPGRKPGYDLVAAAGGQRSARRLTVQQMYECLLPETVYNMDGDVVATRPAKYEPPVRSGRP